MESYLRLEFATFNKDILRFNLYDINESILYDLPVHLDLFVDSQTIQYKGSLINEKRKATLVKVTETPLNII